MAYQSCNINISSTPMAIFKISNEDFRFVIGIILTLLLSKMCNLRKGKFPIVCAVVILCVMFDLRLTFYILLSLSFNIILLYLFRCNEYIFTFINFIILYVFKLKGKLIDPKVKGTYDISGVLMLTTIKMCYLGKEFDRKKHSIRDVVGYLTFIPGLVMGPTPTFIEYIENEEKEPTSFPMRDLLKSLAFLILFKLVFDVYFPISVLYKEEYSFLKRLINLYCFNLGQRMRFYFAWNFTNVCYTFQGFENMQNVDFFKIEFATSIKDLSQGWNIKVNGWLKTCFFEKLKHKGVLFASLTTFIVSAFWHGINFGYLIMFLSFCISIPIVKHVNNLIGCKFKLLLPLTSRIKMVFFIMYFSSPFFILN